MITDVLTQIIVTLPLCVIYRFENHFRCVVGMIECLLVYDRTSPQTHFYFIFYFKNFVYIHKIQ